MRFTTAHTNKTKMHSHTSSSLWESLLCVCVRSYTRICIMFNEPASTWKPIFYVFVCIVWCDDDGDDDDQRYIWPYLLFYYYYYYFLVPYNVCVCVCVGLNFSVSLLLLLSLFCTHSICDDARMKHDSTVGFSSCLFIFSSSSSSFFLFIFVSFCLFRFC